VIPGLSQSHKGSLKGQRAVSIKANDSQKGVLMTDAIATFVEANQTRFVEELQTFLRIPSISTLTEHRPDIEHAAEFVAQGLRQVGIENIEIIPTENHPLVYGDWLHADGKPTVLCYGHYDVQPADPLELWHNPPFEPVVKDGNIYGRGSADDKGQMHMHLKAAETLRAVTGTLPVNLKFLIEGEEEIGGTSITRYIAQNPGKLRANVALVSDTALFAPGVPTLCIGLRGEIYLEVEAAGPARDLHSGLYGGAAPNAIFGLIELLAKAKDSHGEIQVPGVYDGVVSPPPEKEAWSRLPFDENEFLTKEVGSTELTGETKYQVLERIWGRPTFEVHGIVGGFTGAGSKTVIPAKATAKVSFRLAPEQDPEKVIASFRHFVKSHAPRGIQMAVRLLSACSGVVVDAEHPAIQVAARALNSVFQKQTVFTRSGASIPIVSDFAVHLGITTVLMGFGLPDDRLHSPNEKFSLDNYFKGIVTIAQFFEEYGAVD
jgi:acetylornithine deacetylase/succinyl-diaminopimelate desuccinylase-like protein